MNFQNKKRRQFKTTCNIAEKIKIEKIFTQGKFHFALSCYQEYLEKYPKDRNASIWIGKLLRLLKNNSLAHESLEQALLEVKTQGEIDLVLIELIYLCLDEYEFKKAYQYFLLFQQIPVSNEKNIALNTSLMRILLKKKLGIYSPNLKRDEYNYFERQFIQYQEEDLLSHIIVYNLYGKSAFENENPRFQDDVNIYELLERIKMVLPISEKTPNYNVLDTYLFYYPNIEILKEESLNYLKVCVIPDKYDYQIVEFVPCKISNYKIYVNYFKKLETKQSFIYKREKNLLVK